MKTKLDNAVIQKVHRLAKSVLEKEVLDIKELKLINDTLKQALAEAGQFKRYFRRLA